MEEINRNPNILPNISLLVNIKCNMYAYYKIVLSSRSKHFSNYYCKGQRRYLIVLTGPLWRMSAICAPLLYISRTPAVYYGYFNPLLNAQEQFPHLHQMSHKDTSLALAMVSLVVHFKWNWVGMIISDDDHGIQFLSEWRGEMQSNIVCLAFVTMITTDPMLYFKMLNKYYIQVKMSTAKVVIVYGDKESHLPWNFVLWQSLDIWKIWVSESQFDMITVRGNFLLNSPHGTFIFSRQHSEVSGFKQFLQTVHPLNYSNEISLAKLWWSYFKCSLPLSNCNKLNNCPTKTLLKWLFRTPSEMSMSDTTYNLYNAVYAVAHSIHEVLLQQVDTCSKNAEKKLEFEPWKMFSLLKTMQFVNPAGDLVNLNQKLKLDMEYDIFYIMDVSQHFGFKMKIGKFSRHFPNYQKLYMSDEMIEWATGIRQDRMSKGGMVPPSICSTPCSPGLRKSPQQENAVCCFDCNPCPENEIANMTNMDECVKCPYDQYANKYKTHCLKKVVTFLAYEDPLGISLVCLALCFSALTAVVLCVFLKHQDTPIVKANNRALSYVLLISLIFCFLCPLLYIGHPHTVTCILQQITFAIVFTVATSTVLAKTITVVLAFKVTVPDRRMRSLLVLGAPNFIIPICTIIQIIFCGIWVGTSPPFVDADVHMEHDHIIIVCNKGSVISFYCVLGFLGSLALASFTVSFLARNLPDTFNEAKFLTFSMLVFCSVWITFLAVYHSTKGKALVAMEVFCILASSAGLFFCIFVPKCYIILLRPKINSLHKFHSCRFSLTGFITFECILCCPSDSRFSKNKMILNFAFWEIYRLTTRNIHLILSLFFAIKQINWNIHVLPNISLVVKINCAQKEDMETIHIFSNKDTIIPNYNCRHERRLLAVFIGTRWFTSIKLEPFMYIFAIPQLYYGPFHPLLRDREHFPYLYQMSSNDAYLASAMMALMVHFSWNWVGLVISDNNPGIQFLSELRGEMHNHRVCLAFVNMIAENIQLYQKRADKYYNQILASSAKVIIIYGDTDSTLTVHFRLWQHLGIQRLWITTSQWEMTTIKEGFISNHFHGTLILSHHHSEISGFKKFIQTEDLFNHSKDISLARLWWMHFNCSLSSHCNILRNCSTKILLEWLFSHQFEVSMRETSYNLYNAVYAVAYVLHKMLVQQIVTSPNNSGKGLKFYSWCYQITLVKTSPIIFNNFPAKTLRTMLNSLMLTDFYHKGDFEWPGVIGLLRFSIFVIFSFWNISNDLRLKVKIGKFSKHFLHSQQLYMTEDMTQWTMDIRQAPRSVCRMPCSVGFRKLLQKEKAVCCFDCIPCPKNEISNMSALLTDMDQCVKCPHDQYANTEQTQCIKKVVTYLAYEDPLGIALAYLAVFFSALTALILGVFVKHRDTPIVKANNRGLSYVLLISLIFCFLCSLLFIGRPHMTTCILQQITFAIVFTVAVSTILAKTMTVVMAFRITDPRKNLRWLLLSGAPNYIIPICTMIQLIICGIWLGIFTPFVDMDSHFEYGHIIISCNKGSVIAFYCVLGYLCLLALGSFTIAFLARNLPDTFNEAKFLTFSMLVFCSVWVTFLPVYHSTKGKAMVVVEIFSILASSAGLLVCIFAPKCITILLRPEINFVPKFRDTYYKTKNVS
ncbi:vomeronasal type-2 receptor 116-like [Sigmodon hispidus]